MTLSLLLRAMRPAQWTKNLFVFAALLFHIPNDNPAMVGQAVVAFVLFSAVSGCIYIFNDFIDLESDRANSEKQDRPLAAGLLSPRTALVFAGGLLLVALCVALVLRPLLAATIAAYLILNVAYSLRIKHIPIADLFAIAAGFVLRAIAGGVAIQVPFTSWFLLCAMLLSLFLATGKRRYEVLKAQTEGECHRDVLREYSPELLNQLNGVTAALVIMAYSMFSFTSRHTPALMLTIPFVIYGVFRYLLLIHVAGTGGRPEHTLIQDRQILLTVFTFAALVVILLWTFH
ncbi:decaprenyl-phosphate phosphoribosyltransferase [Alicyclobacillus sp. SP_1]|uniref:decaprenyl-phosphate phosphoribosyltransferase n=1 Tax=Alicyclobacillus sp. SP_1 TaxID=2942475 RepID=UPI002157EA07|nr:decaprenyl-phosphate phosphoribosyltransferase [Alicyclobacillus sp. SP_1]